MPTLIRTLNEDEEVGGYIMVKAFADAWFWNSETSNTSVYPETQATVDAHGYVVDTYLVSPVRLSKVL